MSDIVRSRPITEITRPLSAAERQEFEEFKRFMRETVVPRIIEKVKARRRLAVLARGFYFDFATEREMHNAWRKRAEEAEAREAIALTQRGGFQVALGNHALTIERLLGALRDIADGEECDAIRKARRALAEGTGDQQ